MIIDFLHSYLCKAARSLVMTKNEQVARWWEDWSRFSQAPNINFVRVGDENFFGCWPDKTICHDWAQKLFHWLQFFQCSRTWLSWCLHSEWNLQSVSPSRPWPELKSSEQEEHEPSSWSQALPWSNARSQLTPAPGQHQPPALTGAINILRLEVFPEFYQDYFPSIRLQSNGFECVVRLVRTFINWSNFKGKLLPESWHPWIMVRHVTSNSLLIWCLMFSGAIVPTLYKLCSTHLSRSFVICSEAVNDFQIMGQI